MLLGSKRDGLDTVGSESLVRGNDGASTKHGGTVKDADARVGGERACDVGEWGEICNRDLQECQPRVLRDQRQIRERDQRWGLGHY